jgi:hypothetical protein
MFTFKVNDTIYDLPEDKVADFKATYPDAVEVTEEIQTDPTEGKTNGAVAKGATATPQTGQAPESTESDSIAGLLESVDLAIKNNKNKTLQKFDAKTVQAEAPISEEVIVEEPVPVVKDITTDKVVQDGILKTSSKFAIEQRKLINSYRDKAKQVIQNGGIYNLGVEGKTIEDLVEVETAVADEIKKRSRIYDTELEPIADTFIGDQEEVFTRIIQEEIEKERVKESKVINASKYKKVDQAIDQGVYDIRRDEGVKQTLSEIPPLRRQYGLLNNQRRKLESTIFTSQDEAAISRAKRQLVELQPELDDAFMRMQIGATGDLLKPGEQGYDRQQRRIKAASYRYLFDEDSGNRVGLTEAATASNVTDYTEEVEKLEQRYYSLDEQALEREFVLNVLNRQDNEKNLATTYDLKPTGQSAAEMSAILTSRGYKTDANGIIKNVPISELRFMNKDFVQESLKAAQPEGKDYLIPDLPAMIDSLYDEKIQLDLTKEALNTTYVLNIDPASINKTALGKLGRYIETAAEASGLSEGVLPTSVRKQLDEQEKLFLDAGITLTPEQKKNFERTFGTKLVEGLGEFTPEIFKFFIANKIAGAAGITRYIAGLAKDGRKVEAFLASVALEEIKFQGVSFGEAPTGAGGGFAIGGMAASKFIGKFSGELARFNNLIEKSIGGAVGGVAGSNTAVLAEAIISDLTGSDSVKKYLNDYYGAMDDPLQEELVSAAVFGVLGITKLKGTDFKSISSRRKMLDKLNSEIRSDKAKIEEGDSRVSSFELENKERLAQDLKRTIDQADKPFNDMDLGKQSEQADKALEVINDTSSTLEQKRQAQTVVANYEANKTAMLTKISKIEQNLKQSEVFKNKDKDGPAIKVLKDGETFADPNTKAEYDDISGDIKVNAKKLNLGVVSEELYHAVFDKMFDQNPKAAKVFKEKIQTDVNNAFKDKKFTVGDKKNLTFEEAIKEAYKETPSSRPEEYVANVVNFLQQPQYRDLLLEQGLLPSIKRSIVNIGNKMGIGFNGKTNFTTAAELINFLEGIGTTLTRGTSRGVRKKIEQFEQIQIDGQKLIDMKTGEKPVSEKRRAKAILESINELVPTEVKTREDYFKLLDNPRVEQRILDPTTGRLNPAIENYIRSRSTSSEMAAKNIENVTDRLINFDPAKKRADGTTVGPEGFGEFIFANTRFGGLKAKEDLFIEGERQRQTESIDAKEAKQVADVTTTTEIKKDVIGKKPSETIRFSETALTNLGVENKQQAEAQISEAISKSFEGKDITRFGETRNVPQAVADIYGKMFGVNPETIVSKKRNFQKTDAEGLTRIKQFLIDNAPGDFARLPKTKDGLGKGTFLPKNVTDVLYTDGKLTGTLKDYMDLIREKPVKPIYRDRVGQTNRGLVITSIRNRIFEDLVPVQGQRLQGGARFAKDIKEVETNYEDGKFAAMYGRYIRGEELPIIEREAVEDFITKAAIKEADKGKSAEQFTKAIKNSNLPPELKEGNWTKSDKKFKEDADALKNFDSQGNNFASQIVLPEGVANKSRNIMLGLFAGHYNIVGSEMAKVGSSFKQNILKNIRTEGESVLSESTLNRLKNFKWDNLKQSYASENQTAFKNIQKANTLAEQQKIARETFTTEQGKASIELYDIWNTALQEWLYASEPGSKAFNNKADYILKLKKSNASIGTSGERILAPPGYVYLPGKTFEGTRKFEHLKSSSQQSFESAMLVLEGKWSQTGKETLKAYNGIWGLLDDFNIVDKQTGKVNDSNIFRFAENLDLAKNIYSVESNFKKTLYQDIVNKVGKKNVKQFEKDQSQLFNYNNKQLPPKNRVEKATSTLEVLETMKSLDTQATEARTRQSKDIDLSKDFNDIIENKTGIGADKVYSRAKAQVVGAGKGSIFKGIPYSAQDFTGLLYETLGKGKVGDQQMAWYKKNLIDPFARGVNDISRDRVAMMNDYKNLKKQLKVIPKDLRKKLPGEPYTKEQAVRVYTWNTLQGMEVPGVSKTDLKTLNEYVSSNKELSLFANQLVEINKGDGYAKPKETWLTGSITTDLLEGLNTTKRAKYLDQWQTNVDQIFSEANLNKLEAAYGKKYRKAIENSLQRMKTGRNRSFSDDSLTGRFTDWLNGSIGVTMFFNTRSALLQTLSSVNFVNFSDNNPLKAAKAFGNQKQYWKDFKYLMNSDFLKERRGGLRMNVNEADIAEAANKNGPRGVVNRLLQFGFTPTQIADSFAIASGGATFYRNRVKTYEKQGLSTAEAEAKAFEDFRETAEESQQSSRPDRISMQQAGPLGRPILAYGNTPAQYVRLTDKAIKDLKAGRGDAKTNISKIIYYTTVQNLIFNSLQQGLFAIAFGEADADDEKYEEKYINVANGMADSILRGTGVGGAAVSVGKNAIIRIIREQEKKMPKLEKVGYELTKISPPVSSKLSKINQAARSYQWDKDEMISKGFSIDNPAYLAGANVISATTNVPLDRAIRKVNNVIAATEADAELWERLALMGGWPEWSIEEPEDKKNNKPQPRKTKRKIYKR